MIAIFNRKGFPLAPQAPTIQECLDIARSKNLLLAGAVLENLDLDRANFSGLDLTGALLQGSSLNQANFDGCTLSEANLSKCSMRSASLADCVLNYADLQDSDLRWADLTNTQWADVCVDGLDLDGANVQGAIFTYTRWANAKDFVMQMQGSEHCIIAINRLISIGCITLDYDTWLRTGVDIATNNGYSHAAIAEYQAHLTYIGECYERWLKQRGVYTPSPEIVRSATLAGPTGFLTVEKAREAGL